jgi:hypothetical protein
MHPYRVLHRAAWAEAARVLRDRGLFVLNVSNFYAGKEEQNVSGWHVGVLRQLGFRLEDIETVKTSRQRFGANRERVEGELILLLRGPSK